MADRLNSYPAVAVFGGTYNPVHNGHLRSALELCAELELRELRLMPCYQPVHRDKPECSVSQRLRMLDLAVEGEPTLSIDRREIDRSGPSYMVDSLIDLRAELGEQTALCMVVGSDAFAKLETWHRWQELLDYAHIIVLARPGYEGPESTSLNESLRKVQVNNKAELFENIAGSVLMVELTQLLISASAIRELIRSGKSPRFLLPESVWQYICEQNMYDVTEKTES